VYHPDTPRIKNNPRQSGLASSPNRKRVHRRIAHRPPSRLSHCHRSRRTGSLRCSRLPPLCCRPRKLRSIAERHHRIARKSSLDRSRRRLVDFHRRKTRFRQRCRPRKQSCSREVLDRGRSSQVLDRQEQSRWVLLNRKRRRRLSRTAERPVSVSANDPSENVARSQERA
jgi:hypothetical protein